MTSLPLHCDNCKILLRPESRTAPAEHPAPIRAELNGSTECDCEFYGVSASGHAPALALCRELLAVGVDPDTALLVYRSGTLSLRVRSMRSGQDLDMYIFGREEAPIRAEVKGRKNGGGFVQLERWLSEFDLLAPRRNDADPIIVLPWRTWAQLIKRAARQ